MKVYSVILLAACAAFAVGRPSSAGCDRPCPFNYEPVCGSDGVTYNNKCLMAIAFCKNPQLKMLFNRPCRSKTLETLQMFQSPPVPMHFKDMRREMPEPTLIEHKPEPTLIEHKPIPMHPKDMIRPVPTLIKDAVQAQIKPKPVHFRDMIPLYKPVPVLFGVESLKHIPVHPMDLLDNVVAASYVAPSIENEVAEEVHRPVPMHFKDMVEEPKPTLIQHMPVPMHFKDMKQFAHPEPTLIQHKPEPTLIQHMPVPMHPKDMWDMPEPALIQHKPVPMHPKDMWDMPEPALIQHKPVPMHPKDMWDMPEPALIQHKPVPMHPKDMVEEPEPALIQHMPIEKPIPTLYSAIPQQDMPVPVHPMDLHNVDSALYVAPPTENEVVEEVHRPVLMHFNDMVEQPKPTLIQHKPVPMHFKDMVEKPEPALIEHKPVPMHPKDMWDMPEPTLIEHKPVPMHFKDMREIPEPTLIEHKPVPMHFKDMREMPKPTLIEHKPVPMHFKDMVEEPEPTLIEHEPVIMHFMDMLPEPIPELYSLNDDAGCPLACPMNYDPICGSDGVTYSNPCNMEAVACLQKATVTMAHKGEC